MVSPVEPSRSVPESAPESVEAPAPQPSMEPALPEDQAEGEGSVETPPPPSLQERLLALEAELAESRDLYLRAHAELENFKKRTAREQAEFRRYANERLLRDLLPILDGFDRALRAAQGEIAGTAYQEGMQLLAKQLHETLRTAGLEPVSAEPGSPFDPTLHEAVAAVPSSDHAENTIVELVAAGYRYKDRILRPSRVVVARAAAASAGEERGDEA
ncbi:MAG: nucleotide exchange factor GrpE [Candidatus Tectomicrobia bacterium]|nr:nucleotide exchange factor GrpE [Candidatus Tectomicrobia bacterium]